MRFLTFLKSRERKFFSISLYRFFIVCLLAAIYYYSARLGQLVAIPPGTITVIWIPSGVSLAAILMFGYWVWPGVLIGSFLSNIWLFFNQLDFFCILFAYMIAIGSTLQALLGAFLLQKLSDKKKLFDTVHSVFIFVEVEVLSCAVASTLGVTALSIGNYVPWSMYGYNWMTWWLGDLIGVLVVAPILLSWARFIDVIRSPSRFFKFFILTGLTFITAYFIFSPEFRNWNARYFSAHLLMPFVIWSAFWFGQIGTFISILIIACVSVLRTALNNDFASSFTLNDSLVRIQIFTGIMSGIGMSLAAALHERRFAEGRRLYLASIVESSNDAIIGKTLTGLITSWNKGAEKMYGYTASEIIGKSISVLMLPEHSHELYRNLKCLKQGKNIDSYETVRMTKDGRRLDISRAISAVKDENDRIVGAAAIERDITEKKRAEERIRQIVESAPNAMIMSNKAGKIVLINSTAEKMLGYTRKELIGESIEMLIPRESRDKHISYRSEYYQNPEIRPMGMGRYLYILHKDGTEVPVEIGLNPIQTAEGLFILASIVDITERKKSEDALRRANERLRELDALKDKFVAMTSHEFRTPLAAIKEGLSLLVEGVAGPLNSDQLDIAKTVNENVGRLVNLIDNMLDLSKIEAGHIRLLRQSVSLGVLVESVVRHSKMLLGGRTVQMNLCDVPNVFADPQRIMQIFGNLLSNAIKFTENNGTITFLVEEKNGKVSVSVKDNGVGIAKEDLLKLFQKFSRVGEASVRRPGTGLGLVLCKELVNLHKGTIDVVSRPNEGTTFIVSLPIYMPDLALEESFQDQLKQVKEESGEMIYLIVVDGKTFLETLQELCKVDIRQNNLEFVTEFLQEHLRLQESILCLELRWIVVLVSAQPENLKAVINRLIKILREWILTLTKQRISLNLGLGTAIYPMDGINAHVLLASAVKSLQPVSIQI